MSSGPGNILIRVGAEAGQAVAELSKVNRTLGDTMTTSQKMQAGVKKAAIPAAAALAGIGYAAVGATKAALEDAAAQEKLAGQLERTTGATDAQVKAAEDYITKLSLQTGIADDELRPALGKLAAASHDVAKGQKLLALATDISAQSGEDLGTVSDALAKGYLGQTRSIGKLVPGIDKATLASKDMTKITAELARLTGGAAAESAGTAAGQYKVFQVQVGELQEALGAGLIPVIQALAPLLTQIALFAQDNARAIQILVGIVAALAGGILAANAALKLYEAYQIAVKVATAAWTAAQWLLNAALDANPIGLVILAVAALGAALVVAYKKSETFRDVVSAALEVVRGAVAKVHIAFDNTKDAAVAAYNWITDHWKLALFAFGPIGAAVYLISENFDKIKAAASAAYDYLVKAWKVGSFAFSAIANNVARIAVAFGKIKDAVDAAIEAVRRLLDWLDKIDIGGKVGKLLDKFNPFVMPPPGAPGAAARGFALTPAAAAGGTTINVNVTGAVDPEGTARAIRRILDAHERRQGRVV